MFTAIWQTSSLKKTEIVQRMPLIFYVERGLRWPRSESRFQRRQALMVVLDNSLSWQYIPHVQTCLPINGCWNKASWSQDECMIQSVINVTTEQMILGTVTWSSTSSNEQDAHIPTDKTHSQQVPTMHLLLDCTTSVCRWDKIPECKKTVLSLQKQHAGQNPRLELSPLHTAFVYMRSFSKVRKRPKSQSPKSEMAQSCSRLATQSYWPRMASNTRGTFCARRCK